jgi:hypothetical protein
MAVDSRKPTHALLISGNTASSTTTEDNNSEYCAASGRCLVYVTSWRLAAAGVTPGSTPLLQLSYEYVVKDYDDVSNRCDGTLSTLTYQVSMNTAQATRQLLHAGTRMLGCSPGCNSSILLQSARCAPANIETFLGMPVEFHRMGAFELSLTDLVAGDCGGRANDTSLFDLCCLQLTSGCILGQAATSKSSPAAARPTTAAACVACSAAGPADPRWTPGHAADAGSPTCVRCPPGMAKQGPSAWTCVPGLPAGLNTIAVRMGSAGVPECASADGMKCSRAPGGSSCAVWASQLNTAAAAAETLPRAAAQPLRCGADHKRAWGVTGYDTPGHWCTFASDYFQDHQSGECSADVGSLQLDVSSTAQACVLISGSGGQ